jgi:hypothetical protein
VRFLYGLKRGPVGVNISQEQNAHMRWDSEKVRRVRLTARLTLEYTQYYMKN